MSKLEEEIQRLESRRKHTRFANLVRICQEYFGCERIKGSHHIFKTPWPGDPRINLQKGGGGKAKPYQVDQVISALEQLKETEDAKSKRAGFDRKGDANVGE
jgi:hypothetical protein